MYLLDLPPELVDAIVYNIHDSKKDLCTISLTCHVLHDHASPLLYSKVTLLGRDFSNRTLFRFAETMLNNPHLASFVKYFSGPLYPIPSLSKVFEPLEGWLQHIVNLKTLRLLVLHNLLKNPYPNCPFSLESLEISFQGSVLPVDLETFLQSQPDLFSLTFSRLRTSMPRLLSPRACPKLKVLCGSLYTAKAFLPGRRVVRFEWKYESDHSSELEKLISEISDELNNLRSLSYKGNMVPYTHLHSLRFLEIQRRYSTDWMSISTLPCLRILLVSEQYSIVYQPDQVLELLQLFKKIPTLQYVDMVEFTSHACSRWLRGAEEPVGVPLWVVEKGRTMFLDDDEEDT